MIALATGQPSVEVIGERIVLSVPSGNDTAQIAMTLDQALCAFQRIKNAAIGALNDGFATPPAADLIAYPSRKQA